MIHIMHLIESLEFGGAEKVVVHLANHFSKTYKVSICLTKRKGDLISQLNENIEIYCLHSPEGNNYSLPGQLKDLLIRHKVDILHSHDWGVYLEAALAIRNTSHSTLIHTIHGPYLPYPPGLKSQIKIVIRHFAERLASRYVCKIVSVSDSIKHYISEDIGISSTRLQTIHNGIKDIATSHTPYNEVKKLRFITTGRLAKVKNHSLMLNALSEVIKVNKNIELSIIGDGPERANLERLCTKLHIENYVNFMGFRTDVHELLLQHDVFLLSSNYEGISIALLEAMSLSMPAISTDVGGIPETIINSKTGYLVPDNDVNMYAQAILKMLSNHNEITKMGKNAREHFLSKFHEDVVLEQYDSLYKQCLEAL